jgi:hypothetical protein
MVGEAYQQIHAVEFPAPLCGPFGPERLELAPCDPVALLHSKVEAVEPAVRSQRPTMVTSLARLRDRIDAGQELRREVPCLVHSDANFHNIVVGTDRVTLIDWDYPAVRYPLEELERLEEHAYLHGLSELPAAFFAGYVTPAAAASSHRGLLGHVQLGVVRHSGRHPASCRSPVHAPHVG